jgi:cysteine desulfurase/selenocysteine lyase
MALLSIPTVPPAGGELARWREEFPFLGERAKGCPIVYLDSGASTQKPRRVLEEMAKFAATRYANVHRGIHELSTRATEAYEAARRRAAEFLGAPRPECVVFTRGTTEAINLVANTWGGANVQAGDTILATEMEHHSNLVPWQELARRAGARIEYVPVTDNGAALDLERALELLAAGPRLFAFTHVSNTLGVINPVRELCAAARAHGVTTLVDSAQGVGHLPVDVAELGCDFLACSAHKMCGPTGIGLLYGRHELLEAMPPWQFGGEMVDRVSYDGASFRPPPARFEAGTPAIIEAAGLHAAIDFIESAGLGAIARHCEALAERAAAELRTLPGVRVFGPPGRRAGLVTFHIEDIHAHDLVFHCNERGVALRAGHHCAQPLMRKLGAPSSSRASFYLYNRAEDIDRMMEAVRGAIAFFRG